MHLERTSPKYTAVYYMHVYKSIGFPDTLKNELIIKHVVFKDGKL